MNLDDLTDSQAIAVLQTVTDARARRGDVAAEPGPGLAPALASALEVSPEPAGDGETARMALRLLAEDPETRQAIEALAASPRPPDRFLTGGEIALVAAVLIALQTRVKIRRKPSGEWDVLVDKKAGGDGLLKSLAAKLLAHL